MTTSLDPYAARNLPMLPQDDTYTDALRDLVIAVNGFPYAGDRLNAVVDTVKVLRANCDLARLLLAEPADLEV